MSSGDDAQSALERQRVERLHFQAELQWRLCAQDFHYFVENFWFIQHPDPDIRECLFVPRPEQREVLGVWLGRRNSISLKARQIGWSTLVAAYTFWQSFFHPSFRALLLSRGEREAVELLSKCVFGYLRLPEWMRERGPKRLDDARQAMTFGNGSKIESLPSASDPARGYSGSLVVCDEFAFLSDPEGAWASIKPVADIGGQIIILSTANGSGSLFHTLWKQAVARTSSFVPSFYSWRAVPERDDAWYELQKQELMPWQLHQEYPDNPEEAFIKSGNMVFPYDIIQGFTPRTPRAFQLIGEQLREVQLADDGLGQLLIWGEPEADVPYSMGGDVAEGLGHGDRSVLEVLSPEGVQQAEFRGIVQPDELARYACALGRRFNDALAVIEANNHGFATIALMLEYEYPHIWRRRQPNTVTNRISDEYGWKTTNTTKAQLIDALHLSMREGMEVYSLWCRQELFEFVRDAKGRMNASSGSHDDTVIALGLANWGRPFLWEEEYRLEPRAATYSAEWWLNQIQPVEDTGRRIGAHNVKPERVAR